MVETRNGIRKRAAEKRMRRSERFKKKTTVSRGVMVTRSMTLKQLLEDERIRRIRVKPEKLMDLPDEMLIEIMKRVNEENIGTVPQICTRMRDIFKDFEHEFAPPAASSTGPMLNCDFSRDCFRMELVKTIEHSRLITFDPSYSRFRRCLKDLDRLVLRFRTNPPDSFVKGTKEFKHLKTFIENHCSIRKVVILHSYIRNVAENVMDLFPEKTVFLVYINVGNLLWEPRTFFENHIERLSIYGSTPVNFAYYLMNTKNIKQLFLFCLQPLNFHPAVESWRRKEKEISWWQIQCPPHYRLIPYRLQMIVRQYEGNKILRLTARPAGRFFVYTIVGQ